MGFISHTLKTINKTIYKDITFNQQSGDSTIVISSETLLFEYTGGTKQLTITSNDDWTLS